jgi:hypothetical protein
MANYCASRACGNKPLDGRALCGKCRTKKYRRNNPISSRLSALKQNAKRRGIDISLTLAEFTQFCEETGYVSMLEAGVDITIDRKDDQYGYHLWNLQILTRAENTKKEHRARAKRKGWSKPLEKAADDPF